MLTAEKVGMYIMITIKIPSNNGLPIIERLQTTQMGLFVAEEWKRLINPYTPRDTDTLESTAIIEPFTIRYIQPYSHYQYMGILYVDPVYEKGAFYNSEYGFWSRPNIKKIPSDRMLKYQTNNPYSTDHWDEKAAAAGQLQKLEEAILRKIT